MKNIIGVLILIALISGGYWFISNDRGVSLQEDEPTAMEEQGTLPTLTPISHATFSLAWDDVTIYNDPVGGVEAFDGLPAADIILLTDIHSDHLNVETLEGIVSEGSVIIAPQAVFDELTELLRESTFVLENGETLTQNGISIEAIPAYNLPDQGVEIRHEKGRGNGYVLEKNDTRVYIAGDTADIPEMRALTGIDIAFVPMNLPYTMSVEDAADAVLEFAPKTVYPYHFRTPEGFADVEQFKALVRAGNSTINVVIAEWYPE